jgi:hypothetical protein
MRRVFERIFKIKHVYKLVIDKIINIYLSVDAGLI